MYIHTFPIYHHLPLIENNDLCLPVARSGGTIEMRILLVSNVTFLVNHLTLASPSTSETSVVSHLTETDKDGEDVQIRNPTPTDRTRQSLQSPSSILRPLNSFLSSVFDQSEAFFSVLHPEWRQGFWRFSFSTSARHRCGATYQCQLLTLVASARSSTIHRGSPWPHFAIVSQISAKFLEDTRALVRTARALWAARYSASLAGQIIRLSHSYTSNSLELSEPFPRPNSLGTEIRRPDAPLWTWGLYVNCISRGVWVSWIPVSVATRLINIRQWISAGVVANYVPWSTEETSLMSH